MPEAFCTINFTLFLTCVKKIESFKLRIVFFTFNFNQFIKSDCWIKHGSSYSIFPPC